MLKDKRKLFTITQIYDENFIFPGMTLPGPQVTKLTQAKTYEGKIYEIGETDPEWIEPDIINIHLGTTEGRFWYSIRDDISTDISTMGKFTANLDPKIVTTVTDEQYQYFLNDSYAGDVAKLYENIAEPTLEDIENVLIKLGVTKSS
jgi:hypothetical protein